MTLTDLLSLAMKRQGSIDKVRKEIPASRQRIDDALKGGAPLRAERLVRLGLLAGVDPITALRAGGRSELADLLEEARGKQEAGRLRTEQQVAVESALDLLEDARKKLTEAIGGEPRSAVRSRPPRRRPK